MKSIVAPDEPLTPGVLYVGVATLTGSIIARNRILFTRLLLPPTLFVLSLNHFLPKSSHNLAAYFGSLEDTYFPTLADKHATANARTAMAWEMAKEKTKDGRDKLGQGVTALISQVESLTGLKLQESMGLSKEVAAKAESNIREAVAVVEQKTEAAKEIVVQKTEAAQELVEQKVEEARVATEKKVEEAKTAGESKPEEVKRLV